MITPSGNTHAALGGFLLLFVASRLLYVVVIEPSYILTYGSEEIYRGTIAHELVTGLKMPFTEYPANNYEGGSLVIGALVAGFFLLFGPTVLALKLAPLFLFTLALVFWYSTIQQYAGERVAGYFAMLFCFSPPLLTAHSVTAMGFHSESIFFSALTLFLLFRMISNETGSLLYPVLLGLTAGFGLWFTYIYGLTLLALLGFWLWHDKSGHWRPRVLWFALGFVLGFSPWLVINMQTLFAGLMVHDVAVWKHFGLKHLWDGLSHPWKLAPYEFFADIASDDPRDLPRRVVNLLYSLLYLGPILTAGVLCLKTVRSNLAAASPTLPTLVGFGLLYLVVFALAVQFSDFRATRYHLPAYPFLFLFVALSQARCQDAFPNVQKKIQTIFLASVVLLGLVTHAPLLSLDRPGVALFTKGYAYALLPGFYLYTHAPTGSSDSEFILEVVRRPFLSDILPKLSSDDQRDLSLALVGLLAAEAPLSGKAGDFSRIERLVPPGFDRYFYYQLGMTAMGRHANQVPDAVAAVDFLCHRSAAAHRLALIGIYRAWSRFAALDSSPEALVNSPVSSAAEMSPHYWRALGYLAGRSWYDTDRSLSLLKTHLQAFVPRLDPSVQKYFLQGAGELLFVDLSNTPWIPPAELERFPLAYQEGILEGWGMALGEDELFSFYPWKGEDSPVWVAWTKGLSARSLMSIRQGKAQFDALFEGSAASALEPPRHVP